jgi:hypothetical protein
MYYGKPVFSKTGIIAVGRPVTRPPPHRSRRAVFPHRALQEYSLPQSSLGTPSRQSQRRTPDDTWALDPEVVQQGPKPSPGVTPPLPAAIEPPEQDTHRTGEELMQAGRVPIDAIVVVIPLAAWHATP